MNSIQQLTKLGQSLWYDNIQRRLLDNGELAAMIARGDIRGVTSNPSIFHNALAKTNDYDSALTPMAWSGWEAETIFWQLAIEDIRRACDLFRPLYEQSKGGDGYVSLEVHPALAHNSVATLTQAKDLWARVARPNLMIKIPATKEGLPAVRAAIAAGINVNVTLIFSIERYREVMEAYLCGLEDLLFPSSPFPASSSPSSAAGVPASVASFFVSRMDTKVDALLGRGDPSGPPGQPSPAQAGRPYGQAAIASARLAYAAFRETFAGPRWEKLAKAGARLQRPLWASTSTKNPAYPDTIYVDNLIGPDTVNTVPPQTLDAFRDHGQAALTITENLDDARRLFAELESRGISIARVTQELEDEGVQTFADAFAAMLAAIEARRSAAAASLGPLAGSVQRRISRLEADAVPARLWSGDPSLWTADPQGQEEIRKRLGWLTLPETSRARAKAIQSVADEIHRAGIHKFLLLGMGGSSLAPEVLSLVFGGTINHSQFSILDSTDPAQVARAAKDFPPAETLYIVSSKSGGTAEVNAMLDYFWHLSGGDGARFVAITDPGTSLDALANARGFRKTFLADPSVGGRFSVLADFGLLPAALMGFDIEKLLASAAAMMNECRAEVSPARNPGLALGAVMGEAALAGRDKLTIIADPQAAAFGSWLEQLIAESSGKQGKGIIVVDGEPVGSLADYGADCLFIYFKVTGEHEQAVSLLRQSGQPVAEFLITNPYSLFSEFYRWEIATAIACHVLGVNAFDQPDVQDNKNRTKAKITAYSQNRVLEEPLPAWEKDGIKIITNQPLTGSGLKDSLAVFLASAKKGDYVAINAYLPRNAGTLAALTELRLKVRARTGCATTVGFGPRFLHSTGQLHKGGPDTGLFLQITADPVEDLEIPGQGLTFGVLERAQALGDYEALAARGRRVLRLHLPAPDAVRMLVDAVK
ncbi:MAG: transaldolase / glucose-6-phosphate isomerase [Anaerolineaceae bacterium]|nr:MAG: transaldolase / glucose-6-phosphate isomerase [Anaerolineaceae bacterium]